MPAHRGVDVVAGQRRPDHHLALADLAACLPERRRRDDA